MFICAINFLSLFVQYDHVFFVQLNCVYLCNWIVSDIRVQ